MWNINILTISYGEFNYVFKPDMYQCVLYLLWIYMCVCTYVHLPSEILFTVHANGVFSVHIHTVAKHYF